MFCKNCGSQIDDNAVVCPHCGVQVGQVESLSTKKENNIAIIGFILSFFIAIAGLVCSIIGFNKAKNEGAPHKGYALAGIIISVVEIGLAIVLVFISCVAVASVV